MNYITPQTNGRIFESKVQNVLEQTRIKVLNELEVKRLYGNNITAVDHMMIYNNTCYCFQDKWVNNSISISDFNHFTKCVEYIASSNNMYGVGIYISNKALSLPSKTQLETENHKFQSGQSRTIFHSISDLNEYKLLDKIHMFLHHTYQIVMYDKDGDCIMG